MFRFFKNANLTSHSEISYAQSRWYWAAITKNIKLVQSRITYDKNNNAQLEVWEPYKYKYFKTYVELHYKDQFYSFRDRYSFLLHKKLRDFGWYEYKYGWGKKLTITSTGIIEDNTNISSSVGGTSLNNTGQIISSDFFNSVMRNKNNCVTSWGPNHIYQNECVPDMLYSIPPITWNNFIAKLPSQDIVNILNLSTHRHLWKAYNYAISAKNHEIRIFRAEALSKYHFLASLCNHHDATYLYSRYVYSGYPFEIMFNQALNVKEIFNQIDQGNPPGDILKNRLPYLTAIFLNKFSHCPIWEDVSSIGMHLILPKVIYDKNKIDKQKLDDFVAALPSSKKKPEQFAEMIKDSHQIFHANSGGKLMNIGVSSRFFYHARNRFGQFKITKSETGELIDYLKAIIKDLIYPELIRNLFNLSQEQLEKLEINDAMTLVNNHAIIQLEKTLEEKAKVFLAESATVNQLMHLQIRWHRNLAVINANKPIPDDRVKWHALFERQTINKITFTCLTTEKQLRDEGSEMNHCVGGYSASCCAGTSHIVKIETETGERATLELRIDGTNISIEQNRGKRNTSVSKNIEMATQELVYRLKENNKMLNSKRGEIKQLKNSNENRILAHRFYPYPFSDKNIQEQIYQAYKNAKVLPTILMANTYSNMLTKSRITQLIQDQLQEIYQNKQNIGFKL